MSKRACKIVAVVCAVGMSAGALGQGKAGGGAASGGPDSVPNSPPPAAAPSGKPRLPIEPAMSGEGEMPRLLVGDAAPPLTIEKWIKGEPVKSFVPGHVYVVEFWATWCRPCKDSIPHLTELQAAHRDGVTIIGVSSLEQDGAAGVESLVRRMGPTVGYTIAWDDAGKSNQAWMVAAAQDLIPTAFVVEKTGKIAWIGHPMDGLDSALQQVLDGTLDLAKAAADSRTRAELNIKAAPLKRKLNEQMDAGQFEDALATMDQLIALSEEHLGEYALLKFVTLSGNMRDSDRAYAYARDAIAGTLKNDPQILGALAWAIAEHPLIERRDFVVAELAAARANEVSGGKSPLVLGAMARVAVERGQWDRAVTLQEQAVRTEPNKTMRADLEQRLEEYRRKRDEAGKK